MGLSFAAMLSGANDLRPIWRWGRRLAPKGLAVLGIDRERAPCHAAYHDVFRAIPAADLERALGAAVRLDGPLGHVATDGKRLRGSQHETSPGVHMLQAFSIRLQASIGSLVVPPDSGEAVEALKLLQDLPLEGAVVTGDAAFTAEKTARAIRDRGGHYFLFVKGNQPDLKAEIARRFGDDSPPQGPPAARARVRLTSTRPISGAHSMRTMAMAGSKTAVSLCAPFRIVSTPSGKTPHAPFGSSACAKRRPSARGR
ncbi:MAG: ISAs1 family transposase [Methylocystis sp.]|nr:ISAs1 family transposase [Methylocystis sp.]MCA3592124.1 ISAs1 family transposase [Methylocystis sp.]